MYLINLKMSETYQRYYECNWNILWNWRWSMVVPWSRDCLSGLLASNDYRGHLAALARWGFVICWLVGHVTFFLFLQYFKVFSRKEKTTQIYIDIFLMVAQLLRRWWGHHLLKGKFFTAHLLESTADFEALFRPQRSIPVTEIRGHLCRGCHLRFFDDHMFLLWLIVGVGSKYVTPRPIPASYTRALHILGLLLSLELCGVHTLLEFFPTLK